MSVELDLDLIEATGSASVAEARALAQEVGRLRKDLSAAHDQVLDRYHERNFWMAECRKAEVKLAAYLGEQPDGTADGLGL